MKKFRKKLVAGNWKMNKTVADAQKLADGIKDALADCREVDVVLCPPFTALKAVGEVIDATSIKLGAQNMHWEASGAYTGEISGSMLRDLYCHYVILGHSERRSYFGETNDVVNRKVKAALGAKLIPIVCVGETLQERDAGRMQEVVESQLVHSLADLGERLGEIIVAYEPVWAIGTGRTASPEQAQDMHAFIREAVGKLGGVETASKMRLLYGGSMKPDNAVALLAQPDIDGGLIGGAALETRAFVEIVRAAIPKREPGLPAGTVE
ncbi:MAG: triose-phosphate isomerase [Lentisphaerae bacterium]|nr:triose-phosphate isomerase [Lentisphaerota bacterium]